jgi:hypothetical protein
MGNMAEERKVAEAISPDQKGIPEIHAHESYRKYKLIDLDNSAIERTAKELIEGSKLLSNSDLWIANFAETIARVRRWCKEYRGMVRMALVDIRSNKVIFYFVPDSEQYDLLLGDHMTALEVELGGSAGIGYVETLQVPDRSLERFAGKRSLLVWTRDAIHAEA